MGRCTARNHDINKFAPQEPKRENRKKLVAETMRDMIVTVTINCHTAAALRHPTFAKHTNKR